LPERDWYNKVLHLTAIPLRSKVTVSLVVDEKWEVTVHVVILTISWKYFGGMWQ